MALQNRVTPWSVLVAHPVRYAQPAAELGNRGRLHDDTRNIVRKCQGNMWVPCNISVERTRKTQRNDNRAFNGRRRELMIPRRYTDFFVFFWTSPWRLLRGAGRVLVAGEEISLDSWSVGKKRC